MDISIVVPLLNEVESLPELHDWVVKEVTGKGLTYEMIFIDDGSNDGSWEVINAICRTDAFCKGIRFRRNHGKSAALFCGFEQAQGDVVITMDADLQDNPKEIPPLYDMIMTEDYDLVSGWKKDRKDPIGKTLPSKFFNGMARRLSGIKLHDFNCGLKAYRKEVVKSIEVYGEMHRYIPILVKHAGYDNIGEKIVEHQSRKYGYSKFGLGRMRGMLDIFTLLFMAKFGKKPMHFFGSLGSIVFFIGLIFIIYMIIDKAVALSIGEKQGLIAENPLFYISLTCMIIGSQLFLSGFVAEMISRNATERNIYHIAEKINCSKK